MTPLRQIRIAIFIVIFGLVISGVTAFPLLHELNIISKLLAGSATDPSAHSGFIQWILLVQDVREETYERYPFKGYSVGCGSADLPQKSGRSLFFCAVACQ